MRKICYVLVVVLFCTIFTACGSQVTGSVSTKVLTEMDDAWQKKHGDDIPWNGKEGYFGTYAGAVVFGFRHNTMDYSEVTVAGEVFASIGGATVVVYKDGEFYGLLVAYETGILTQENIKSIAKHYEEYVHTETN